MSPSRLLEVRITECSFSQALFYRIVVNGRETELVLSSTNAPKFSKILLVPFPPGTDEIELGVFALVVGSEKQVAVGSFAVQADVGSSYEYVDVHIPSVRGNFITGFVRLAYKQIKPSVVHLLRQTMDGKSVMGLSVDTALVGRSTGVGQGHAVPVVDSKRDEYQNVRIVVRHKSGTYLGNVKFSSSKSSAFFPLQHAEVFSDDLDLLITLEDQEGAPIHTVPLALGAMSLSLPLSDSQALLVTLQLLFQTEKLTGLIHNACLAILKEKGNNEKVSDLKGKEWETLNGNNLMHLQFLNRDGTVIDSLSDFAIPKAVQGYPLQREDLLTLLDGGLFVVAPPGKNGWSTKKSPLNKENLLPHAGTFNIDPQLVENAEDTIRCKCTVVAVKTVVQGAPGSLTSNSRFNQVFGAGVLEETEREVSRDTGVISLVLEGKINVTNVNESLLTKAMAKAGSYLSVRVTLSIVPEKPPLLRLLTQVEGSATEVTEEVAEVQAVRDAPGGAALLIQFLEVNTTKESFLAAVRDALGKEDVDSGTIYELLEIFSLPLDNDEGEMEGLADAMDIILTEIDVSSEDSLLKVLYDTKQWCYKSAFNEAIHNAKRPFRRSRLMVVGESASGKSSFVRAFTGQDQRERYISTTGFETNDFFVQRSATKVTAPDTKIWSPLVFGEEERTLMGETCEILRSEGVRLLPVASSSAQIISERLKKLGELSESRRQSLTDTRRQSLSNSRKQSLTETRRQSLTEFRRQSLTETRRNSLSELRRQSTSSKEKDELSTAGADVTSNEPGLEMSRPAASQQPSAPLQPNPSLQSPLQSRIQAVNSNAKENDKEHENNNSNGEIDMSDFKSSKSDVKDLAFSVWDYGGQRVFQTVQHLFLSRYGVYVLAFDLSKLADSAKVENSLTYIRYWLRQIGMNAMGAPLILLGTHYDSLSGGESRLAEINNLLLSQFSTEPALVFIEPNEVSDEFKLCFFPVNNEKTDPNIMRLRTLVGECAEADRIEEGDAESYVNSSTPVSWLKMCDELKRLEKDEGEPYIRRDKFEEVAQKCGVFDNMEDVSSVYKGAFVSSLLDHLNNLGIVVTIKEAGLDDVVVLSPQWILDCMVCLVRDYKVHPQKRDMSIRKNQMDALCMRGVLTESMLKIFWEEYEADIPFLIKFLIKIGVMCELPRPDQTLLQQYLVPAVLITDSAITSAGEDGLQFSSCGRILLSFQSFLPEGLLTRFIVSLASQVKAYASCQIVAEKTAATLETPSELVLINQAPSVFMCRGSFSSAIPVGPCGLVCLITQSGADALTVSVLGEAAIEAASLDKLVDNLKDVLDAIIKRFYKGITFSIAKSFCGNIVKFPTVLSIPESIIEVETVVSAAQQELEPKIATEVDMDEQALRASAENELSEWLRKNGGVGLAETRKTMAKILFDAGWESVQLLRDAFDSKDLPDEEIRQYFPNSAHRAFFRAALTFETEVAASETSGFLLRPGNLLPLKATPPVSLEQLQSQPQPQHFLTDVFISYAWGFRHPDGSHFPAQERVKAINSALKRRGLVTWFDCNEDSPHRMEGQMTTTMAAAIENTACVIVVITDLYRDKVNGSELRDNCWKEFNYACNEVGPQRMVPVVAETNMANPRTWKGALGIALSGMLYVNATGMTDGPEWESEMEKLSVIVKKKVDEAKRKSE